MSGLTFVRVSKDEPCEVCGKPDWCGRSLDRGLCVCMRTSDGALRQAANGGFVHVLREPVDRRAPRPPRQVTLGPAPRDLADKVLRRVEVAWRDASGLDRHARALGVKRNSLESLLAFTDGDLLQVPMFDGGRRVLGVRVRHIDGSKWSWPGGREGVFLPIPPCAAGPILLPEGPTSSAALLDLGFAVVGRPCAKPGALAMASLRTILRGRDVVLVGENDRKPDGRHPGAEGAIHCAQALLLDAASVRVIYPPRGNKDSRDAIRRGWSRGDIAAAIAAAEPLGLQLAGGSSHE